MGNKTSVALFLFCNALLWSAPDIVRPFTGEDLAADPVKAPKVVPEEHGVTLMSAATTSLTLGEQLDALEQKHGVRIILHPAVSRAEHVSDDVKELSPEIALRILLRGFDFYLQYGAEGEIGTHQLKSVWIYPRNEGKRLSIVSDRVLEAIRQPVPRESAAELRDAMARSTEEAQDIVVRALDDEDENIRHDALQASLQEGLNISSSLVEDAFLHDQSEALRAAAFEALILRSETETIDVSRIIDQAMQDPSPLVQSRALALREALNPPVEPPQPALELPGEAIDAPPQPEQELMRE